MLETRVTVPYFRPSITEAEVEEVVACLRSGWLTTGPRVEEFERRFASSVRATHAVAVNSCTAALHLAVEALGLRAGQAVLVPTLTFAATAEVVRYQGATPILVDCDPDTLHMDMHDATLKLKLLRSGGLPIDPSLQVVGVMPVHVGGLMMDASAVADFAARHQLWVVEDAAHAFPAAMRRDAGDKWTFCGENTSAVTCFSFYTNKTITTGEGGMAVTGNRALAERMRKMSLHGLSTDAWNRYNGTGNWDYRIVAPGYKYNLTDLAACLGLHQLQRADAMRCERERLARNYIVALGGVPQLQLPSAVENRIHAWHLFPLRIRRERLGIDRNTFLQSLREHGVGCSVHWRPLHLHPYYRDAFGWTDNHCAVASDIWETLISLPLFPGMQEEEQEHVVSTVRELCMRHAVEPTSNPDRVIRIPR